MKKTQEDKVHNRLQEVISALEKTLKNPDEPNVTKVVRELFDGVLKDTLATKSRVGMVNSAWDRMSRADRTMWKIVTKEHPVIGETIRNLIRDMNNSLFNKALEEWKEDENWREGDEEPESYVIWDMVDGIKNPYWTELDPHSIIITDIEFQPMQPITRYTGTIVLKN